MKTKLSIISLFCLLIFQYVAAEEASPIENQFQEELSPEEQIKQVESYDIPEEIKKEIIYQIKNPQVEIKKKISLRQNALIIINFKVSRLVWVLS